MWIALTIVAVIALGVFYQGPNAVWGAATAGLLGGIIAALIYMLMGQGFHPLVVGKWFVVAVLVGAATEGLFRMIPRRR